MILKYKVVEVWPNDHLIVVRYYTDKLSEMELMSFPDLKEDGTPVRCRTDVSISVPIPEPTAEELEKLIISNAPIDGLKTLEMIKDPTVDTSLTIASTLLNVEKQTVITTPTPVVYQEPITDSEIDAQVQAAANT
jgi:hypothetical protein